MVPLTLTTLLRPDSKRLKADNEPPDLHKEIVWKVNQLRRLSTVGHHGYS